MRALIYRNLVNNGSTTDAASFATASITPLKGEVLIASVTNSHAAAATLPTLTGNGLTWVQIATVIYGAFYRLTLFRAQGSAPSAGASTFAFGGVTQTGARWSIDGWNGCPFDFANNGAAAVGNVVTNTAAAAAISVNYSGTVRPTSAGFCAISNNGNTAMTPRANWTENSDAGHATPNIRLETQVRNLLGTETAASSATAITGAIAAAEIFLEHGSLPTIEQAFRRRWSGLVRR